MSELNLNLQEKNELNPEGVKLINKIQYKIKDNFFIILFNTIEKDFNMSPPTTRLIKPYLNEIVVMLCSLVESHIILINKIKDDLYNFDINKQNKSGDDDKINNTLKDIMVKMLYWIEILQPNQYKNTTQILHEHIETYSDNLKVYFVKFLKVFYYHVIDVIHYTNMNKTIYQTR